MIQKLYRNDKNDIINDKMILLMIKWYRNDIINDKNDIEMIKMISLMIE